MTMQVLSSQPIPTFYAVFGFSISCFIHSSVIFRSCSLLWPLFCQMIPGTAFSHLLSRVLISATVRRLNILIWLHKKLLKIIQFDVFGFFFLFHFCLCCCLFPSLQASVCCHMLIKYNCCIWMFFFCINS